MIAHRVFRCLECEQYVVFPSNLPDVASTCNSIQTLDMPFFETINKSDLSQSSFPYDFNSLQASSSDSSNLVQSVVSSSHFPNPLSFFSTDVSHIPFPQVTDLSMSRPVFDSYDTSSYKSRMETDQSDEVALLRSEVERLKDVVQTLQQRYPQAFIFPIALANPFRIATWMIISRTQVLAHLRSTMRTWRQWLALILFERRFLVCLLNLRRLHVRETI